MITDPNEEVPVTDWDTRHGMTVHVYRTGGEFRWRVRAGNGEIVASGESHPTKFNAIRAAHNLFPEEQS